MKTPEFYHMLQKYLEKGQFFPYSSRRLRADIRRACDKFITRDGRLYYVGPNNTYMRLVVINEDERKFALNKCHINSETGNHHGVRLTRNKVIAGYYWPTLIKDVTDWVKSCEHCQTNIIRTGMPVMDCGKQSAPEPITLNVTHAPVATEVCPSADLHKQPDLHPGPVKLLVTHAPVSTEVCPSADLHKQPDLHPGPVKLLVTHAAVATEVCPSADLHKKPDLHPGPVKVLVTHSPVTDKVCHSAEEEDLQHNSRLPLITTLKGVTTSEEMKPYFHVVLGNVQTLLDPPSAQHLLGKNNNKQSTQSTHTTHTPAPTREKEVDISHIYKKYLLQELEVRKADLQYTKLKIRKLELEIKKMEKEAEQN